VLTPKDFGLSGRSSTIGMFPRNVLGRIAHRPRGFSTKSLNPAHILKIIVDWSEFSVQ